MSKFDITVNEGEEGVVTAYTNVIAWSNFGATLADNDAPGSNNLPIVAFHT